MSIIAFANQKGGVGKTMTVAATASILRQQGHSVLLVCLDPQRNLEMVAGEREEGLEISRSDKQSLSVLSVLRGECTVAQGVIPSEIGDLLRASNDLYGWLGNTHLPELRFFQVYKKLKEAQEMAKSGSKYLGHTLREVEKILTHDHCLDVEEMIKTSNYSYLSLSKALSFVRNDYDYILIDTNPSLSLLTLNALFAADYVVIPVFPESSAVEATLELWETIRHIQKMNPEKKLEILGVLMTKFSPRRLKSQRHALIFQELFPPSCLFQTKIRETERASEYVEARRDVVRHDPKGNTSADYRDFVVEMKARISEKEREAVDVQRKNSGALCKVRS